MREREIVVFGAGGCGRRITEVIKDSLHRTVTAVIDNGSFGYAIHGVEVAQASLFLKRNTAKDCCYIVGGTYEEEMYQQLLQAGIPERQIDTLAGFAAARKAAEWMEKDCKNSGGNDWRDGRKDRCRDVPKGRCAILFDCASGFAMGGVENWTYALGGALKERGYPVRLFTGSMKHSPPESLSGEILFLPFIKDGYEKLEENAARLLAALTVWNRVTFVLAHGNSLFCMAMLLKRIFPEKIRIVSVIHSSLPGVVRENLLLEEAVDGYLCVNHAVKKRLENELQDGTKAFFRETPVAVPPLSRAYTAKGHGPIRIGYAARLEKEHKRADRIPELIGALESARCDYRLHIAGEGSCLPLIRAFVAEHGLGERIRLCGKIAHAKMRDFWLDQDIAVNISETEGCSLSMLESMACGCVQVLTDTPGADWFIRQGENGFLTAQGELRSMAERIRFLDRHRDRIAVMGNAAYETAAQKCRMESYADYMEALLNTVWNRGQKNAESIDHHTGI